MKKRRLRSQVKELKFNVRRKTKKLLQIAKLEEKREEMELDDMTGEVDQNDQSALRSIYDPQSFAEKLFKRLQRSKHLWDIRLLMMNLVSRCVSTHSLMLFPFYSYIVRYLKQSQKNVTQIIAYTAQATHKLVPPEIITPVITHIAHEFVGQFACDESIAVGINAIRLLARRQPLAMKEDLLHDLAEYTKHKKDRAVQMAARSLIWIYRMSNPVCFWFLVLGFLVKIESASNPSTNSEDERANTVALEMFENALRNEK